MIPFFVVGLIVGWAEPVPEGSDDMAEALYAVFLGWLAGLLGMVIAGVLAAARYFAGH